MPDFPAATRRKHMQSTKDSKGGKSSPTKKSHASSTVSDKAAAKKGGGRAGSPTGPLKHGEKKTTPG
jgi:hypothetical protein